MIQQNLRRDFAARLPVRGVTQVILRDERGENFRRLGAARAFREKGFVAQIAPAAHVKHLHTADALFHDAGNNVEVAVIAAHVLLVQDALQARDLIAIARRLLVLQMCRGLLHARHQLVDDLGVLAFQKQGRVAHILQIRFLAHQADARRRAALDLILQTRPRTVAVKHILALAHRKNLLHQM